jgi:hypothetical protein
MCIHSGVVLLCRLPEGALERGGWSQEAVQGSAGGWGRNEPHSRRSCDGGACIICLAPDQQPIQSGCACRGDAGLAHIKCRAEAAAYRMTTAYDGWWACGTCQQPFTGVMALGLAEEWWSRVHRLPEDNEQRLAASMTLAIALHDQGKYVEAEAKHREMLVVVQRLFGPEDPRTLATTKNLANSLHFQDKHAEAELIYSETLARERRVLGPEHPSTLGTLTSLADALDRQGKFTESEPMLREALAVQRRVLGPEHPHTLVASGKLAASLYAQGKCFEAEIISRDVLELRRRVLGSEHPHTLMAATCLADALNRQGNFTEAEPIYREALATQRRVIGPDHPQTVRTANNLVRCIRAAKGIADSAR